MAARRRARDARLIEALEAAEIRLPAGLVRLGPPADGAAIAAAERKLGKALPRALADLLSVHDGAELFSESLVIFAVGNQASEFGSLVERNAEHDANRAREAGHTDEIVFGESGDGDLYALELEAPETHDEPRVFRLRSDAEERWLAGSSLPAFVEAMIAHQALLYDDDGEFLADAFEPDGEELTPTFALRQAERALRKDATSAVFQHERGLALRRMGNLPSARAAFAAAAAADPSNPWPWFDLGRADHDLGRHAEAAAAFECAAEAGTGPESARFCAWGARAFHLAGERATAERLRVLALEREPRLIEILRAAAAAAAEVEDGDAVGEAEELAELLGATVPLSRRLPVLSGRPPVPTRPPRQAESGKVDSLKAGVKQPGVKQAGVKQAGVKSDSHRPGQRPAPKSTGPKATGKDQSVRKDARDVSEPPLRPRQSESRPRRRP